MTRLPLLLLLASVFGTNAFAQNHEHPSNAIDPETGFRMQHYRAPVPAAIPGGETIDAEQAMHLWQSQAAVFVDVYPPTGLGPDPLDGFWVTNEKRHSIPGATWLPDTGRGYLTAAESDYYRRNLQRLSNGQLDTPLVIFCTSDCWQSWNAAKRAIAWGFRSVNWFPLGTDGWREVNGPLERLYPVNFLDDSTPAADNQQQSARVESGGSGALHRLPDIATIYLVDQQGEELAVGKVTFKPSLDDQYTYQVELDSPAFNEQFLSMRPFRCLDDHAQWYCHLPYPYRLSGSVSPSDLTELEYQLLFIWKPAGDFGIDAWNGLYYRLSPPDTNGTLRGALLQGDLNVLADPPEPLSLPIDLNEFIDEDADSRRFPALLIRP